MRDLKALSRADDTIPAHGLAKFTPVINRKKVAHELASAIDLLRVSGLPWLVLRVTGLTDDAAGHPFETGDQVLPGKVSRIELAKFILRTRSEPELNMRELNVGSRTP